MKHFVLAGTLLLAIASCSGGDRSKPTNNGLPNNANNVANNDPAGFSGLVECAGLGLVCDGVCTTVLSDGANCGACGHACEAGRVCEAGACVEPCGARRLGAGQRLIAQTQEIVNGAEVADLDGDGLLEYVVLEDGEYTMSLRLGRVHIYEELASGGLERRGSFDTNSQPETILFADLDGNGDLDIVVLGPDPHRNTTLTTILTDGDEFSEVENDAGVTAAQGFMVDWNDDGTPDLLLWTADGMLIGINDGGGAFAFELVAEIPAGLGHLGSLDVDDDGRAEFVTWDSGSLSVAIQSADLSTQGASLSLEDTAFRAMASGDLDGDATAELVIAGELGVHVVRVAPDFSLELVASAAADPDRPWQEVQVADVDGDGQAEIYLSNGASFVLEGGELHARPGVLAPWGWVTHIGYNPVRETLVLSSTRSAGGPGHVIETTPGLSQFALPLSVGEVAIADVDEDGAPDFVFSAGDTFGWTSFATMATHTVSVPQPFMSAEFRRVGETVVGYQRTGKPGEFGVVQLRPTADGVELVELQLDGVSDSVNEYVFADLDRDGTEEWLSGSNVIATNGTVASVQVDLGTDKIRGATDLDGDGFVDLVTRAGVFAGGTSGFTNVDDWSDRGRVNAADLNGDGLGDLYDDRVYFGGPFPRESSLDVNRGWEFVVPYDFDADGDHEFVTIDPEQPLARIYSSQSRGIDITDTELWVGGRVRGGLASDVDGDGYVDLVLTSDGGVVVLRGSCN